MAVFAPIPSARASSAVSENDRCLERARSECRRSDPKSSSHLANVVIYLGRVPSLWERDLAFRRTSTLPSSQLSQRENTRTPLAGILIDAENENPCKDRLDVTTWPPLPIVWWPMELS